MAVYGERGEKLLVSDDVNMQETKGRDAGRLLVS